jgi:hypothetical protein
VSGRDRYLVELTAYDTGLAAVVRRYYANENGFLTKPTDTPANTYYEPVITQPANVVRSMFAGGQSAGGRVGFGTLKLNNVDDALQELLELALDGRDIRILWTDVEDPEYSDFDEVLVATMEQAFADGDEISIKVRDLKYQLDVPLQTTKFDGTGDLEGAEDLKGKPKPLVFGTVQNVSPVLVNAPKRIYEVHDGLLEAIPDVYDRGITLKATRALAQLSTGGGFNAGYVRASSQAIVVMSFGSGTVRVSTDAVTFTPVATGITGGAITCIHYCQFRDIFIIGNSSGHIATGTPDGLTWTNRTSFASSNVFMRSIASSPDAVVMVGQDLVSPVIVIGSSANGTTGWTARTSPFVQSTSLFDTSGWGGDRFIIGGYDGQDSTHMELASSLDGTTWTRFTIFVPSGASNVSGVRFQVGLWLITSYLDSVSTSTNGVDWTTRPLGTPGALGRLVPRQFGNLHYLLALSSLSSGGYLLSSDGSNWRSQDFGGSILGLIDLIEFNGDIIASDGTDLYKTSIPDAYASSADLLDDTLAPPPGSYKVFLDAAGSYFRLGAEPDGLITNDAVQGATSADRTTAQIFAQLLDRGGLTPVAGDVTAADSANSSVIGLFADEEMKLFEACDQVAGSVGFAWFVDAAGGFRLKPFEGPAASTDIDLEKEDLLKPPARVGTSDPGRGVPIWKSTVRYAKNYTVQTDAAPGVADARRLFLSREWREESDDDASVQTAHLLATELIEESLLAEAADAAAEATRRLALRSPRRDRFQLLVELNADTLAIDLSDTVGLTHTRVGGTHRYLVIGVETNALLKQILWTVWGPE